MSSPPGRGSHDAGSRNLSFFSIPLNDSEWAGKLRYNPLHSLRPIPCICRLLPYPQTRPQRSRGELFQQVENAFAGMKSSTFLVTLFNFCQYVANHSQWDPINRSRHQSLRKRKATSDYSVGRSKVNIAAVSQSTESNKREGEWQRQIRQMWLLTPCVIDGRYPNLRGELYRMTIQNWSPEMELFCKLFQRCLSKTSPKQHSELLNLRSSILHSHPPEHVRGSQYFGTKIQGWLSRISLWKTADHHNARQNFSLSGLKSCVVPL